MTQLPWLALQRWEDLLFAHWPVPAEALRRVVPQPLEIDLHEGGAWVSVVPFRMAALHARGVPVAGLPPFLELNVRTYVRHAGRAGIYFFSLDASSRLAVLGARTATGLPYFHASMSRQARGEWLVYRSSRLDPSGAAFAARYRAAGPPRPSDVGTLAHFLTERYALFTVGRSGRARMIEVEHAPWSLQNAEAEIERNSMLEPIGLSLPATEPILHFARSRDVKTWPPRVV